MRDCPKLHIWMLLPLIIAMAGFYFSYWSVFLEAPFHQHLHGLTATSWFVLLVIQPWLYRKNNIHLHRQFGLAGLFLAGGVVFSALQVVSNNLVNENMSRVLRYGLTWGDFLFLTGFTHAVVSAALNSKNLAVHARYMVSTAFWALLPALARLFYYPIAITYGFPPPISFVQVVYLSVAVILAVVGLIMILDYRHDRRIYTSYGLVAGGTLFFGLTMQYMGEASWWIRFCNMLLK